MVRWRNNAHKNVFMYISFLLLGILIGNMIPQITNNSKQKPDSQNSEDLESIVTISPDVISDLEEIKSLVDYAIEKYCNEKGVENTYSYKLLESMLHHDTHIRGENKYTYDLDRQISPGLANNRHIFRITGGENAIYVDINTYRMKMYVYEDIKGEIYVAEGEHNDEMFDWVEPEDCVQCDWPDDMWEWEYCDFVENGWEYLVTPSLEDMITMNPDLYGIVIYSLQRYCEENGIEEVFHFEFPEDKVSNVTPRIVTVKVESDNRMLYMDIDLNGNKVHVYQVE